MAINANQTAKTLLLRFAPGQPRALSTDRLLGMYRQMVLIRRVQESLLAMPESGKIGGAMHIIIGHEASSIGAVAALSTSDQTHKRPGVINENSNDMGRKRRHRQRHHH